jgi:hypothetical protein
MATLVKLNRMAGVDIEIYGDEYRRINGDIEDLRNKRAIVTQAEIARRENLSGQGAGDVDGSYIDLAGLLIKNKKKPINVALESVKYTV